MALTPQPVYPTSGYQATDYGFKGMSWEPACCNSTGYTMTPAGTVHVVRVPIRSRTLVTNVIIHIFTAGATLSNCFAGLYNSSGTLLAQTANQSTAWQSVGTKEMALAAAQDCQPGLYDVAWYYNGTTAPAILRSTADAKANLNLTGAALRCATTSDTARTTTLPATLGTKTALASFLWAGVS